jgi:hypothetical protein
MSGPQCCSNPPTLNPSAGVGHVDKFGSLNAYITGSPNSNSAVLLVSDVFGTFYTPFYAINPWLLTNHFYAINHNFKVFKFICTCTKIISLWFSTIGLELIMIVYHTSLIFWIFFFIYFVAMNFMSIWKLQKSLFGLLLTNIFY